MTETPQNSKKVYIKTYGCQMNVYDSERMSDVLAPLGYQEQDDPDGADLVILNTCHIREKAADKVYSELGRIRKLKDKRLKEENADMTVAVAGCVAQAEGAEIMRRAPVVDIVFGPGAYHKLPEMIARAERGKADPTQKEGRGVLNTDFPIEDKFDALPTTRDGAAGLTAFLTVQEGCDKFCTFCVVPYTRGAEFSRPATSVLDEARALVDRGVKEITLLGQNVNAYHGDGPDGKDWSLGRLIHALADIDGVERLRYTTSHPRDMDQELIDAHRNVPALMPYLHLPVQSGSNRILEAMNRKHTRDHYFDLIDKIRAARPDIALSGDFIVGFPGETDQDFDDTMDLIRRVEYGSAFSFKYSPRPGTPGAALEWQVDEAKKDERLQALQALLRDQQVSFNNSMIGKTLPVLLERPGRHDGQVVGRSPYLQAVHLEADQALLGQTIHVTVTNASQNSLTGNAVPS